jgi:hypothetical protein
MKMKKPQVLFKQAVMQQKNSVQSFSYLKKIVDHHIGEHGEKLVKQLVLVGHSQWIQ